MAPFDRRDRLKMSAWATGGMVATQRLEANSTGNTASAT
jgi:hypothetical protein